MKVFFFAFSFFFQQKYSESLEYCNTLLSMMKEFDESQFHKNAILCLIKTIYSFSGKSIEIIEINSKDFENDELINGIFSMMNKYDKFCKNEIELEEVLKAISLLDKDQIEEFGNPINLFDCIQHIKNGDISKALEILNNSIPDLEKSFGKNHIFVFFCYLNIGICFKQKNLNLEAIKYFQKCLEINDKSNEKNRIGTEMVYFCLGDLFYHEKKYSESLENYKKSYKLFDIIENKLFVQGKKDILYKMGDIYNIQNRIEEALECFHSCLKITEKIDSEDDDLNERIYEKLSEIYKNQKKHKEHIEFLEKLLLLTEKIYGINDSKTQLRNKIISISYLIIGYEYFKEINLKETLYHMEKSLIQCEKSIEIDLNRFEKIYELHFQYWKKIAHSLKLDELDLIIKQFTKILEIQEKKYGNDHPLQGPTYYYIAKIYQNEAKFPEAFENYQQSLVLLEKVKDFNDPDIIKIKEKIEEILKYF